MALTTQDIRLLGEMMDTRMDARFTVFKQDIVNEFTEFKKEIVDEVTEVNRDMLQGTGVQIENLNERVTALERWRSA